MAQNPLQQYFRQPKIFLKLPSLGAYYNPDAISGDIENLPIFGMTGMDQIIAKTPDALISGESTVKVIESCCPSFKDAWQISSIDIDCMLVAIRMATFGKLYSVGHECGGCHELNDYDIDLTAFIDHFSKCTFQSKIVYNDLIIRIKPLSYKQATDYNLENFSLQRQLMQLDKIQDEDEKKKILSSIFIDLGTLQNKILLASIESVETPLGVVTEWAFIKEWIDDSDKEVTDAIKGHLDVNSKEWKIPLSNIKCVNCGNEEVISVDLDQSNFFVEA